MSQGEETLPVRHGWGGERKVEKNTHTKKVQQVCHLTEIPLHLSITSASLASVCYCIVYKMISDVHWFSSSKDYLGSIWCVPGPGGHLESPRQAFMVGSLSAPLIMVAKLGDLPEIRAGLLRSGTWYAVFWLQILSCWHTMPLPWTFFAARESSSLFDTQVPNDCWMK